MAKQPVSNRHEQTRDAIFENPTRANIRWNSVRALLLALGAAEVTRGGSMHNFTLNGRKAVFHRPHPGNELAKKAVEAVRDFLTHAGEAP